MYKNYENKNGHFYMLEFKHALKFGITTRLEARMDEYREKYPRWWFRVIDTKKYEVFGQARLIEKILVKALRKYRIEGMQEWLNKSIFSVHDLLLSYEIAHKIAMSTYSACSEAEWGMVLYEPISEMNLNRMIERACKDWVGAIPTADNCKEQESFLIGNNDPKDETVADYILEHLTDEEAYEEYPWIRRGPTAYREVPYND